jgi:hypothetical protein
MFSKSNFSSDEWSRVAASPMLVCAAVSAADPGGLWGLLKEASAGGFALVEAKRDPNASPLLKAMADDLASSESRSSITSKAQAVFQDAKPADIKERALAELRSVAAIVESKAFEEAEAFKDWLRAIAQKAAEAAKEGGFLGFGGVAVSDAEKVALGEITQALNSPAGQRKS